MNRDGANWQPYYVRRADFAGRTLLLIDSEKMCEHIRASQESDMAPPAIGDGVMLAEDLGKRYGIQWGPAPCLHIGHCPFPGEAHAAEVLWTDDRDLAIAAFYAAEQRLLGREFRDQEFPK